MPILLLLSSCQGGRRLLLQLESGSLSLMILHLLAVPLMLLVHQLMVVAVVLLLHLLLLLLLLHDQKRLWLWVVVVHARHSRRQHPELRQLRVGRQLLRDHGVLMGGHGGHGVAVGGGGARLVVEHEERHMLPTTPHIMQGASVAVLATDPAIARILRALGPLVYLLLWSSRHFILGIVLLLILHLHLFVVILLLPTPLILAVLNLNRLNLRITLLSFSILLLLVLFIQFTRRSLAAITACQYCRLSYLTLHLHQR